MADLTSDYSSLRGLLIPDPRVAAIDAAQSVLTQAGPRPGVPESQTQGELLLRSTGTQAASKALRIQTQRAGFPAADAGGFIWQYDGDTFWRGWDVPTLPTHWESVRWLDGSLPAAVSAQHLHALALADGTILVVAQIRVTTLGTNDVIQVQRRDATTGVWGAGISVVTQIGGYSAGRGAHPCMVQLPGGRVLMWCWVELVGGACQVSMWYSDDNGTTWTTGATNCLPAAVTYTAAGAGASNYDQIKRLRAAYLDGDIVLMASLRVANTTPGAGDVRDVFRQYASNDLGCTFALVAETATGDVNKTGAKHDLLTYGQQILFGWCQGAATAGYPAVAILSSAWQDYRSVNGIGVGSEHSTFLTASGTAWQVADADMSLVAADDGVIYMLYRAVDIGGANFGEGVIGRSLDGGLTWTIPGQSPVANGGTWWDCGDTATHPRDFAGVWTGSRIALLHHWDANPGNEDNSIGCLYLGGASTVTAPAYGTTTPAAMSRVNWTETWLPFDEPQDIAGAWTRLATGTTSLTGGAENISTTAQYAYFQHVATSTNAEGLIVAGSLKVNSGGSVVTPSVMCQVRVADGVSEYEIRLMFSDAGAGGQVRLADVNGGTIGTETLDTTNGVDFLVALSNANVSWWVRPRSNLDDRAWQAGTPSTTLTGAGAPAATPRVRWGHDVTSTADSDWYSLHYAEGAYTGGQLALGITTSQLHPRNFAATSVSVADGTKVQAVDGPTLIGDTWHVNTRYDYAASRVLPAVAPSPRVGWRSIGTGEHKIAVALDPTLTVGHRSGNVAIGIYLGGINFRTGRIEGDTGAGSWSTLHTFDVAEGLDTLAYVRAGNSVEPDTGSTDQPYLYLNEAAGWTIKMGDSLRRVAWNGEGKWDAAGKRARLFLSGATNTEPSSGTASLWPTEVAFVLRPDQANYAGYRVVIDSQATVDGDHQIGTMVAGPVAIMGAPYSWGRVTETEANVERTVSPDGTDRTRVRGPRRRVVQFGWADGVDLTSSSGAEPTPDYLATSTAGGSQPAASATDTPYVMEGLVHLLDGPNVPLVYLPHIPKGGAVNVATLNRRRETVYGRMTSPVRVEVVQGTELESEVVRVSQVVIEELT